MPEGSAQTIAEHLSALEQSLLDPETRSSGKRLATLLAEDFVEFGSSGRVWSKSAIVAELTSEAKSSAPRRSVSDLRVRMLCTDAALVTYTVTRKGFDEGDGQTLRSSVWAREDGEWRMVFHQGTLVLKQVTE